MAKKTLLFSATMSLTAGIREKLELLAHTSQDENVDKYCDNMVEQLDTIDEILGVLFNDESPAKEPDEGDESENPDDSDFDFDVPN